MKRLSLKDLMLPDPDEDDENEDVALHHRRRLRYGEAADEVMSLLVEHGSKVEVLDFGNTDDSYLGTAKVDQNGHVWPSYSYRRGSVMTTIRGRQQFVKTVAIPVPISHVETELEV